MTDRDPVVLVVEDDPDLRDLYEETLGNRWPMRFACDEDEALEALDEAVGVALLDRDLGDGSGDAILTAIRERGIDCRVAMVTGVAPDTDVVDMEFDEYLTKPFDPAQLRETVSELSLRSTYDERLREYYSLARKRVLLEEEYGRAQLEGAPAYEVLCDRLAELGASADDVLAELGQRDAYRQLRRERRESSPSA